MLGKEKQSFGKAVYSLRWSDIIMLLFRNLPNMRFLLAYGCFNVEYYREQ